MRLFGSERIASIVDKLGMTDEDALESKMLSNSIEKPRGKSRRITSVSVRDCWSMMM